MTLPKKGTRTVQVEGKNYRWKVGKITREYANITVETPTKEIWQFRARMKEFDAGMDEYKGIPITPVMVRDFIQDRLAE